MLPTVETHQGLTTCREDYQVAALAALAIVIHLAESSIPSPLPGVKPGLANVVTLVAFCLYGWRIAVWVTLLRVTMGSLVLGTFLAPPFFMSSAGAIFSIILLGLAWIWNNWCRKLPAVGASLRIGPVGLSVLAAMAHVTGQFWIAYTLFVPHMGIFHLLPILLTTALLFGSISGFITLRLLAGLRQIPVFEGHNVLIRQNDDKPIKEKVD